MNIAAVAVIQTDKGFWCLKDEKRGIIMPGGKYEPGKDKTFHATAQREAHEEIGVWVTGIQYLWHGPDDSGEWNCFAFLCSNYGLTSNPAEYRPIRVGKEELMESCYAGWYACLFDVMKEKGLL